MWIWRKETGVYKCDTKKKERVIVRFIKRKRGLSKQGSSVYTYDTKVSGQEDVCLPTIVTYF